MDVNVPFKWILSAQKLKELNSHFHIKKYLCDVIDEKWYVQLEKRKIPRGRYVIIIQLIRNRWLKSAVVELDSRIAIFRAIPYTELDSKRLKIFENQRNTFSCLTPVVIKEINLGNKLIIKGKFKFRITSHEDLSIRNNSVSTSLPNVGPTYNSQQIFVANLNAEKQKASNDKCISFSILDKPTDFRVAELSKDLEAIYNNSAYSDVIITCESHQIRAHKAILKARCPDLLLDSLKKDPYETEAIISINMDNLPLITVTTLLFYIYTGKLRLTYTLACDLIYVANMYNLKKLKDVCVDYLVSVLNDENALFIYSFSYSVDEILKGNALKYILQHFSSISNSTAWEQMQRARPDISISVLTEMVKHNTPPLIDLTLE